MIRNFILAASALFISTMAMAEDTLAKVSVLMDGRLLVNGETAQIENLDQELQNLAESGGSVWYYREAASGEPPAIAMEVIKLVVKHQLPISMSTKPDFSDYVDERGVSKPR